MLVESISTRNHTILTGPLILVALLLAVAAINGGPFLNLIHRWSQQEEYSHGFLIPFVMACPASSRVSFVAFPNKIGAWEGQPSLLEPDVERALNVDDYILSDYRKPTGEMVSFYVTYYASQRKGSTPHSPIVYIPGGWQISDFKRTSFLDAALKLMLPLNRVIITRDKNKELVYTWLVEQNRSTANEYWAKWYMLVDAITRNRTDGALVRLVTSLDTGESEYAADERLQSFLKDLEPRLKAYPPAEPPDCYKAVVDQAGSRQL